MAGCSPVPGDEGDPIEEGDPTGEPIGWFEIGWGDQEFNPLPDGGDLHIVWGSQGAAMFPMPVRGAEFVLPDDPGDFYDEKAPLLDLELDIDGFNDGFGGHFKRIANYPLGFDVLPDGTYEFIYVRVLVPDTLDPRELRGRAAHLWVQLRPHDSGPLIEERDLTVVVDEPPI